MKYKYTVYESDKYVKAIDSLHICGCGNPELAYKSIHEMLIRVDRFRSPIPKEEINSPNGCMLFMAYMLDDMGYLEHDSSIYGAWLTSKGKELLECLTDFEKYDYEYEPFFDAHQIEKEKYFDIPNSICDAIDEELERTTVKSADTNWAEGLIKQFTEDYTKEYVNKIRRNFGYYPDTVNQHCMYGMNPYDEFKIEDDPILSKFMTPTLENYMRRMEEYKRIRFSTVILPGVGFIDMSDK